MKQRITTQRLGLGDTTPDGPFFAKVDGQPIGEDGRAFWSTRDDAKAAGQRFLAKLLASQLRVV